MARNTAAYAGNEAGPGRLAVHLTDIQESGLTTLILFALHVGRKMPDHPAMQIGDLIYNDYPQNLLVSNGRFNPSGNPAIAEWPAQLAALKRRGSVSKVLISIGGDERDVYDFRTIQTMLANGMAGTLMQNLAALRAAFTIDGVCAIDGFDIDCEEGVDSRSVVEFCRLLFRHDFAVTFCPFTNVAWWQSCMQSLWNEKLRVSWWNLQCYSGGHPNRGQLPQWIDALAAVVGAEAAPTLLLPGLAVASAKDTSDGQCPFGPNSVQDTFKGWNTPRLGGGFVWIYDALDNRGDMCGGTNNLASYVKAINDALGASS